MDSERDSAGRAKTGSGRSRRAGKKRVRVVIADDDPIILNQTASLLESRFDVVGRVTNGRELTEAVERLKPAVVVADITMPEMDGIEAARRISKAYRNVKIVMLSVYSENAFVQEAMAAGASGYVVKLDAFTELIPSILNVLKGQKYTSRSVSDD